MAQQGDIDQSQTAEERERLEIQSSLTQNKPPNIGSLLRLFKSEFFDPWIGISYLFKYRTRGVHDYLCEQLFSFSDDDIEFYLAELCVMLIYLDFGTNALETFILAKCKNSIHFALKVNWLLLAEMGELPQIRMRCEQLQEKCEMCFVNSSQDQPKSSTLTSLLPEHCTESASDLSKMITDEELINKMGSSPNSLIRRTQSLINMAEDSITEALEKKDRCDYFYNILSFVEVLGIMSDKLRQYPVANRQQMLEHEINKYNEEFNVGIYLPLWEASTSHYCICRLVGSESKVLKSRERCPFILTFEVVQGTEPVSSKNIHRTAKSFAKSIVDFVNENGTDTKDEEVYKIEGIEDSIVHPLPIETVIEEINKTTIPSPSIDISYPPAELELNSTTSPIDSPSTSPSSPSPSPPLDPSLHSHSAPVIDSNPSTSTLPSVPGNNLYIDIPKLGPVDSKYSTSPFGEPFEEKINRIKKISPYGKLAAWTLKSVIVKFGDDCRQEYLAMQLITQFKKIFDAASLPIYLNPYHILVNSTSSGLIELVSDAISIHQLKGFYQKLDNTTICISLRDHFKRFYGEDTLEYTRSVQNFVESLAGYSLVTFLLQIKDRHNGNILIDSSGHLIHIDFGFMLSNSPGGVNAENAPFKLPQEYLDVLGGFTGEMFKYFKQLLLKGYLEARKHCEKIIALVDMMSVGSKLPCFSAGPATVDTLRDRFNINMTEKQVVDFLETALQQSHDNWRTRGYDRFQYFTNNILY